MPWSRTSDWLKEPAACSFANSSTPLRYHPHYGFVTIKRLTSPSVLCEKRIRDFDVESVSLGTESECCATTAKCVAFTIFK